MEKKFFVFQIIAIELGVANSRNVQQDTWHRQAMCQQTHQSFHLTLGEIFSKPSSLRMMNKHHKWAVMEILQVFWTLSYVDGQSVF